MTFPRLIDDEKLETEIRSRWFSEHNRDDSVYALQGSDFTDAIEKWIAKSFPEHAHETEYLSGVIWLNRTVINHQHHVSNSFTGMMRRFLRPPADSR